MTTIQRSANAFFFQQKVGGKVGIKQVSIQETIGVLFPFPSICV